MARQPGLDRGGLAIGEQVDDPAPFEIADDAAVTLTALPCPIIDADDAQRRGIASSLPAHDPQQGILADRQHQPPRQRGRGPTAQGNAEMMDDRLEPRCAPSGSAGDRIAERLGENAAPATGLSAAKSANRDTHLNGATVRGQVQEPPLIAAVHLLGWPPAIGTRAAAARHRAVMRMRSGPISTSSISKPAGDNDRKPEYTMASIPQYNAYQI